eukprot:9480469-Pyramimonas_sp.AAC.1
MRRSPARSPRCPRARARTWPARPLPARRRRRQGLASLAPRRLRCQQLPAQPPAQLPRLRSPRLARHLQGHRGAPSPRASPRWSRGRSSAAARPSGPPCLES